MTVLDELAETRWDIGAFSRLLGVDPHPGQTRFYDALILRDATRWRPAYHTIAESAGNRAGKTLMLAVAIGHHCLHKMGLRPPDPLSDAEVSAWSKAPYHWYHFGIQQEVGELVFYELQMLLEGRHPAQKGRGCPLVDQMGPIAKMDTKERGEYRWVVFDPIVGGSEMHFRTTNERALGSLGKDMNGISFDECGFEQNLTFILDEVLHMRRLGTSGPLILASTPSEGYTQFADAWKRGDPTEPQRDPGRLSLRMSTRENIGYGIDQRVFDIMVADMPPHLVAQNVDGHFVEGRNAFFNAEAVDHSFREGMEAPEWRDLGSPEDPKPVPGATYVQGVDPALNYDQTWSIDLRVLNDRRAYGVFIERRSGKQNLNSLVEMVHGHHVRFSSNGAECITALDTTGFGGHIFRDALSGIHPLRSVEFGGTRDRKQRLLNDLKGMLEQGRLRFPRRGLWLELRRQLLGYRLEDRKIPTDGVMALAVAVRQVSGSDLIGGSSSVAFEFFGGVKVPEAPRPWRDRKADEDDFEWDHEDVDHARTLEKRRLAMRLSRVYSGRAVTGRM